jgi:hypothetical protein
MMDDGGVQGVEPLDATLAEAVRALARERAASALLEERTVRALRTAGVLSSGAQPAARWWWAAATAAGIALFASGAAVGQWLGMRQTAHALALQQQASMEEMAALVERTGGAYVDVLARLAETPAGEVENGEARAAALQVLHQAANEMVRLVPNDPVSVKILQGLDHAALQARPSGGRESRRQIMWF